MPESRERPTQRSIVALDPGDTPLERENFSGSTIPQKGLPVPRPYPPAPHDAGFDDEVPSVASQDEWLEAIIPGPFASVTADLESPVHATGVDKGSNSRPPRPSGAGGAYGSSKDPLGGAGYYSVQSPSSPPSRGEDEVASTTTIPPAPLLPDLDLVSVDDLGPGSTAASYSVSSKFDSRRPNRSVQGPEAKALKSSNVPVQGVDSDELDTIVCPPPHASSKRRSFAPGQVTGAHQSRAPTSDSDSIRPEAEELEVRELWGTIRFSSNIVAQALAWLRTGSLSLPGSASARHARATQRALLLAMLYKPGWDALPHGLRQRVGWLFRRDWDTDLTAEPHHREVDDLGTVLGMPCSLETRQIIKLCLDKVAPDGISARPPRRLRRPDS